MFSGKSSKENNADGSSVETREENAAIKGMSRSNTSSEIEVLTSSKGAGGGNLNAAAAANAEQKGRQARATIQDKNAS